MFLFLRRSLHSTYMVLRGLVVLTATSLAVACLYDADDRCGPNQKLGALGTCACADGLVLQGQDCVPCGKHEEWEAGVCVCADGYTRSNETGSACVLGGAGTACDATADDSGCKDSAFPLCRVPVSGPSYCSVTCASDDDCPRGFVCDTESTPASCKSSPVGQGDHCESAEDCAGKEASYCESTISHACLVSGCSIDRPLSCSEGWICCDLQSLGFALTLCAPEGVCPTL